MRLKFFMCLFTIYVPILRNECEKYPDKYYLFDDGIEKVAYSDPHAFSTVCNRHKTKIGSLPVLCTVVLLPRSESRVRIPLLTPQLAGWRLLPGEYGIIRFITVSAVSFFHDTLSTDFR